MTSFVQFVETCAAERPDDRVLRGAIASFARSMKSSASEELSDAALSAWSAEMIMSGLKGSTRRKYLKTLSNLYASWQPGSEGLNPFEELKKQDYPGAEERVAAAVANLEAVKHILTLDRRSANLETANIFLFLLFDPRCTIGELINLTHFTTLPAVAQIDEIAVNMRVSRRYKYIFPLEQGKKRDAQISRELTLRLASFLEGIGMKFPGGFSRGSITAMWIAAAFRCGVTLRMIRAVLPVLPEGFEFLQAVAAAELSDEEKVRTMQRVADSIHDRTPRWFVMKLRAGYTADDVCEAVSTDAEGWAEGISFYNPTFTAITVDKQGHKRRTEKQYLPGILFFRLRRDRIGRLFSHIGDMAWCFKNTASPESPYCSIALSEMKTFQKHIGSFTPDVRMELISRETALPVDSQVRINGGNFAGRIGTITSVKNTDNTRTYTLALSDRDFARWTVTDIDDLYLEPLTMTQTVD